VSINAIKRILVSGMLFMLFFGFGKNIINGTLKKIIVSPALINGSIAVIKVRPVSD
jgi:hypothetical protein